MNKIRIRISARPAVAVAGVIAAGALLAACGGGGGGTSGTTPAAAAASPSSTDGNAAYRACLQQHGVTLPSRAPGQGRPTGGTGGGGFFGGGGGGGFSTSPQMQAAIQACASLRPAGGGFGGFGGGRGGAALTAFRNCMTQQGVVIPTTRPTAFPTARPTAPPSGDARYLGGLDPNDPKVAAALKVCSPLIPSRSASPAATS